MMIMALKLSLIGGNVMKKIINGKYEDLAIGEYVESYLYVEWTGIQRCTYAYFRP